MLTIQYFGEIAEKTGKSIEKLPLSAQNCAVLIQEIQEKYGLQQGEFQVAVNHNLIDVSNNIEIKETDEIALLSAFAGG